jgi:hypothetical protein
LPLLIQKFKDELGVVQLAGLCGGIIYYTEISGVKQEGKCQWSCQVDVERSEHLTGKTEGMYYSVLSKV